ncbi:hypothetical protein HELRODRAFT_90493 [Helobdella robusta]|uniref:General transcription factor IIE subunit 1 n=1 Tax=Helobdella robusta TaxID=6412 RepID=T1G7S2_HELRO|nr:hypothetical protein HELRODRAFT_90493 [Helobdella robusta]ESN91068.1 hypothetical protein HELRODRAFT_90493 [Helobdella robusta]
MSGLRLVNEVPDALTRLVRCIVSGFCSVECSLVMDLLIHHPGIKEDDLLEITKFDKKQLRSIVTTLKQDQFIHSRIQMETGSDGKATRHNYYFINYSIFVNVVKYKLDQVRRKIETMERDMTIRASFRCPRCHKTFTDLETGQLFDSATQTYNCTYCLTEVEEEVYDKNHFDSRTLMAKFNEQMEPFYDLLRELDGIKLSDTLLDPPLIKDAKTNNR